MGMTLAQSEAQIRYGLATGKRLMIDKASLATQVAGGIASLWRATGVPGQGAIPGAWAICAAGLLGSMTLANPVAPDENYLAWGWAVCQNTGYAPIIADRLGHSGNLSGTVTTAQTVNADLTVATSNLQERKGDDDYSDVNWYLEWYTATGTTGVNATIAVTYNDGTTGNIVVAIPASTNPGRLLPIISAVAGKFIRGITSVTLSATTGTAGAFGVTAARERTVLETDNIAFKRKVSTWAMLGIPEIFTDSCLFPMVDTLTTTTGTIRCQLKAITV
jgi:hypothetical protein